MLIDRPMIEGRRRREMRRKGNWRAWLVIIPRILMIEGRGRCLIFPFSMIERRFSYSRNRWLYRERGQPQSPDFIYGKTYMASDISKLQWHVPANLRWLADQPDRPDRLPCGELTGAFLYQCADRMEALASGPSPRAGDMAQGEG